MRRVLCIWTGYALLVLVGCSSSGRESAGAATANGGLSGGIASGGVSSSTAGGGSTNGDVVGVGGAETNALGGMPTSGGAGGAGGGLTPTGGVGEVGGTASSVGGLASGGTGAGAGGATLGTGGATFSTPKFIGNVVHKNNSIVPDFAEHWMQVTMEANAKWGFVQPNSASDWVWGPVDEAYNYAKKNGIIYKQHNFIWNFEQPSWVTNANVAAAAETWIKTFCERYPDVPMIDVVNEPLTHAPPYKDGLGGAGVSGYDWAVKGFQLARQYCPDSILLVNDYNIVEWPNDHAAFVTLLEKMLAAGAPIDAIGVQGHDVYKAGVPQTKEFLDDFSTRFNLPIYVTEFDIDLADDAEQLAVMQEAIQMFWEHPNVRGITYWGFEQGLTWRANAHLVRSDGTDRPAMTWLQEFVAAHR